MTMQRVDLERAAIKVVASTLNESAEALGDVGLVSSVETTRGSDTEVSLYFRSDEDVEDVLEFFLWRGGQATANLDQLRNWLQEMIADVIQVRRVRLGANRRT